MKQGALAFVNFHPEFEQCLIDADGSEWPEDGKKDRLCEAVSFKILEAIVGRTWPISYDKTVNLFRKIANDQYFLSQRNTGTPRSAGQPGATAAPKSTVDVMDSEPTPATEINTYTLTGSNPNGHPRGPGLSNNHLLRGKTARWVSEEELNRRKAGRFVDDAQKRGAVQ